MEHGGRRRGAGRPKGSRDRKPRGTRRAAEAVERLEATVAETGPVRLPVSYNPASTVAVAEEVLESGTLANEARGLILQVMRGQIDGRGTVNRLRAAFFLVEHTEGKARQRIDLEVHERERFEVVLEDGTPADLGSAAAASLPE